MKKIREFLELNGFKVTYLDSKINDHDGGKGFYHDGTFTTEIYEINKESNKFFLVNKVTGRPWFFIYRKMDELALCGSPNQKGLIIQFEREMKKQWKQ